MTEMPRLAAALASTLERFGFTLTANDPEAFEELTVDQVGAIAQRLLGVFTRFHAPEVAGALDAGDAATAAEQFLESLGHEGDHRSPNWRTVDEW